MVMRRALLLATALGACSQLTEEISELVARHPRCFQQGFQYTPDIPGTNKKATGLQDCQRLCTQLTDCTFFAFFPYSGNCYFADWKARMVESPYGAIAGKRTCEEPTRTPPAFCRTEVPHDGFPGRLPNASNQAWPSGRQPYSLECWPKNWTGGYQPCQSVTVLQDTKSGWPGKCHGLAQQSGELTYTTMDPSSKQRCSTDCMQNPLCSSWQTGVYGECWQGVGRECYVRENFVPQGAQRLQHGEVRKLMDMSGWQIVGLFKSFDNAGGYFMEEGDAVEACKAVCYSDLRCQFWQYSPKYGCFVEDPLQGFSPAYPLTLDWAYRNTAFALDCIAGEFIQHFCPDHLTTAYPTRAAETLAGCMQKGVRYDPADMLFHGRTVEADAAACQARCKKVTACAHFTFWPDGGCHLQDNVAKQMVAEDSNVLSGPPRCYRGWALNNTDVPETNWLTKEGEEVLDANVPGPNVPPSLIAATAAPPEPSSSQRPYSPERGPGIEVVEIHADIENLQMEELNSFERQQLKIHYLSVLSQVLGVPVDNLRAEPQGQTGLVRVHTEPATGCGVVAYSTEQTDVENIQNLQASLDSEAFEEAVKTATTTILGDSHGAITGDVRIVNRRVQVISVQATTKAPTVESDCGFICSYWPFISGAFLLICMGGLLAGFLLFRKTPSKKRGSRTERRLLSTSDHEQSSSDLESTMDEGDESIWATEPSWDSSPARSARSNSQSQMYQGRGRGDTIFEA